MTTSAIQGYVNMDHPGRCQLTAKIMGDSRCLSNPIPSAQGKFGNFLKMNIYMEVFSVQWYSLPVVNFEREKEHEPLHFSMYNLPLLGSDLNHRFELSPIQ